MSTVEKKAEKALSRENTNCLKGILAICVVLCHLWGYLSLDNPMLGENIVERMIGRCFTVFGYLSVSFFFFSSGYGLTVQHKKKGEQYLKGFFQKRVLPLYLVCILLIFFYWGVRVLFGEQVPAALIIKSFLFGGTVIANGWYLQVILVYYILFYFCFRFIKSDKFQLVAFSIFYFLYICLCLIMKLNSTWYESCLCLVLGVAWAKYEEKINNFLSIKKYFILSLIFSSIMFVVTLALGNFNVFMDYIRIPIKCVSGIFFVILIVLVLHVFSINNIVTRFLGKINLEIYVFHGFMLMLYRCKYIYISNLWLYSLLVIVSSIAFAYLMHPLFSKILALGKRRIDNGNEN